MVYRLLLVSGHGEATTAQLRIRTLREFPGLDGLSVHFRPVRNDLLFESAKFGGAIAYRILSGEGIVRSQLWVEYEVLGEHLNVMGRSSDLLFALALITSKWIIPGDSRPAIAATGVLDSEGRVQGVEGTVEKITAAVRDLDSTGNAIVFYPADDAAAVEAWSNTTELPMHVQLRAVAQLDDALAQLGYVLEKVYLRNPFRGLKPFDYEHHAIFFGRDGEVRDLVKQLLRREEAGVPGLLIEGPSGSGKSSFLRAGVLPALIDPRHESERVQALIRARPVNIGTRQAIWRPGLMPLGCDEQDIVRSIRACWAAFPELEIEPRVGPIETLVKLAHVRREQWRPTLRFVWLIDQFEEILFLGLDEAVLEALWRFLSQLQIDGAWTLAAVRADAMPRFKRYERLRGVFDGEGQYYLATLGRLALDDVIDLPARAADLTFAGGPDGKRLDQLLREEAYREQDSLPLLQFTLNELYRRRSGQELTYTAYQQLGGLAGSIATTAEDVLKIDDAKSQRLLSVNSGDSDATFRRVMRELTSVAEDGSATRRYAPIDSFAAGSPEQAFLDRMINARLAVTDRHGVQPVVCIAHEALLQSWPRVQKWLQQESMLLRLRDELQRDADVWGSHRRSSAWLGTAPEKLASVRQLEREGLVPPGIVTEYAARSRRRARRNRLIKDAAIGGICVLSVLSIIAGLVAVQQRNRARTEAATADRTSRFMVSLFQLASPDESRGNSVTVREVLDRGARDIGRGLEREPRIRADLLTAMGEAYTGLGLFDPARKLLAQAQADQQGIRVPPESRVRTLIALGSELYLAADYDGAKAQLRRAVEIAQTQLPADSVLTSEARDGLADVLVQLEQYPEAERLCQAALRVDRKRGTEGTPILARTLNTLASAFYFQGRLGEAEAPMREALTLRKHYFGLRHARTAESMNNLASLLYQAGRYAEAATQWQEALPVYREIYGLEHPEVATLLNNLGRSALMAGHVDEAIPLLEQAVQMDEKLKGPTHDDLVLPLNSLGMAYLYQGDTARARVDLNRALQIARLRNHWMLDQVVLNAADVELSAHRTEDAPPLLNEARRLLEARYRLSKDPTAQWRYAAWDAVNADLLALENRPDDAGATFARARDVLVKRFGPQGFYVLRLDQRAAARNLAAAGTSKPE